MSDTDRKDNPGGAQMRERSIGVKRLVVILSVVSVIVWVIFVYFISRGFTDMGTYEGWLWLAVGIVVAYFLPQLICKGVYWVLDGFKKDKEA